VVRLFWVSLTCHGRLEIIMTVASKPKPKYSFKQALTHQSSRSLTDNEKVGVTLFLLFFFVVVGAWLLEDWVPFKGQLTQYTRWPMTSLGWTQYWGLFSPGIRNQNYHSTALIEFADGTCKLYEFPRTNVDMNDYLSHFGGEKKRKLFGDNFLWEGYEQFLPSICRFVARANDDPTNPPRKITLSWQHAYTPLPDPQNWKFRDQMPYHTERIIKFVYRITPQDLQTAPHMGAAR